MQIKHIKDINSTTVYLSGELDEHSANVTRDKLDEIVNACRTDRITLDLTELSFMDSTGIGVLIGRYKNIKSKGINLYVKNVNATIDKIFKMSGLYSIMPRCDK